MKIGDRARPSIPPVAPGVYVAVCVYSIELGNQPCKDRNGKGYYSNKVRLGFELIGETVEVDGKQEPRVLGRDFHIRRAKTSALYKFMKSWFSREFTDEEFGQLDTNSLVGTPAQISVVLNDTGEYSNIDAIMALPKGASAPQPQTPLICFDMDPWDDTAFASLPDWAKARIMKSTEYQTAHLPAETVDFPAAAPSITPAPAAPAAPFSPAVQQPIGFAPAAPQARFPSVLRQPAATLTQPAAAPPQPATAPSAAASLPPQLSLYDAAPAAHAPAPVRKAPF